jgi:uncharacterized membrane protein YgdD (TMEM256/DUF423 family)
MNKTILIWGSIIGVFGIVLGAFAAHGLEKLIDKDAIETFETGVRYQIYHAFFLLILGFTNQISEKNAKRILILVLLGVLFFSFSIYGLATNSLTSFDFKSIGFITPIGGLLLILAWILFLISVLKTKRH